MIPLVDTTLTVSKPKLYLCKPNRTIISILSESYNIVLTQKLGGLSELSFSVPIFVDIHHVKTDNPNIINIRDRYNIKLVYDNNTEWFIINNRTKVMDSVDHLDVHCFSAGYELNDKIIRSYTSTSLNASQTLQEILAETIYDTGSIDADFDLLYRSMDIPEAKVLDAVFQVAETFGALVQFDTINREIDFLVLSENGVNRGLHFNYGKLLKSAESKSESDQMCTCLRCFGKDGMSIQSVNPTGTNHIINLTYFKTTDHMSQSLIDALDAYDALVLSKSGDFTAYLATKTGYEAEMTVLENELDVLETELSVICDNLDIAQANRESTTEILAEKTAKEAEITAKELQITNKQSQIDSVNAQITALQLEISIEENFTADQIIERNLFIIEQSWSDESYIDAEDLYNAGLAKLEILRTPQISATIDIVSFLECLSEFRSWDKLNIGDYCTIYHEKLDIDIEAKIIEMSMDFESGTVKLVISNIQDLKSNEELLEELYENSVTTSNTLNMERFKYNSAYTDVNDVQSILNSTWSASLREINAGVSESVQIDSRGITLYNPDDLNKAIRLMHHVIVLTDDGFNTVGVAIDSTGVYAEKLVGQILLGVNLYVTNEAGTFSVNSSGITIQDADFTVTRSDNGARIKLNTTDGILIQKNTGTTGTPSWSNTFSVSASGVLTAEDLIANKLIMKNGGDILINGDTKEINFTNFTTIAGVINAENINLKGLSMFNALGEETLYITSSGDITMQGTLNSTIIKAGQILGTTGASGAAILYIGDHGGSIDTTTDEGTGYQAFRLKPGVTVTGANAGYVQFLEDGHIYFYDDSGSGISFAQINPDGTTNLISSSGGGDAGGIVFIEFVD